MPARRLSNTHLFSIRRITAFLHLETLDSTSVLRLRGILNSELANKKPRNAGGKRSGTEQVTKRTLVCTLRAETSRQKHHLVCPLLGTFTSGDSNFSASCTHLRVTATVPWVLVLRLEINLHIRNLWIMRIDRIYIWSRRLNCSIFSAWYFVISYP